MGNSPSTPEGKDAYRLSRQKSYYSVSDQDSPALRADLFRSATTITGLPTDSEAVIESQAGDRRSRADLRQHIRAQLQSDDHASPYTTDQENYGDRISDLRPTASRDRLSQPLSREPSYSKVPSSRRSQSSLAVDPRTIDLQTAVGILEELRKTASPEDLVALHKALLPSRAVDPESATSAAAVIRRRSLATPGLATRKVSQIAKIENQSSPSPPSYRPEILDASPLSRLEDLKGVKRSPAIAGNGPGHSRSETPADLDYSHLGTYKLGSLMVTNGPPNSPRASVVERRKPTVVRASMENRTDDEYFTAEESDKSSHASDSSECDTTRATPRPINYSRPVSTLVSKATSRAKRSSRTQPSHDGSGSPLKREVRQSSAKSMEPPSPFQTDDELEFPRYSNATKPKSKTKPNAISLLVRGEQESFEALAPPEPFIHARNNSAEFLASEYQAELPESPFASDPPPHDDFGVTPSRETSSPDEGFEDGSSSLEKSPSYSEDSVYSRPRTAGGSEVTRQTALGSHPPDPADFRYKQFSGVSRAPLNKSDSGYSSGASASVHEIQRGDGSGRSSLSTGNTVNSSAPTPALPDQPQMSKTQEQEAHQHEAQVDNTRYPQPSPQVSTYSARDASEAPPITTDKLSKSWRKSMRLQLPRLLSGDNSSTKLDRSPVSNTASEKTITEPRTAKKLQKKRPVTYHAPASHDQNGLIPRVPSTVQRRFVERPDEIDPTLGIPYENTERSKTPMVWDRARPKSAHAKSSKPRPLSSHNATMPNMHDLQDNQPPLPPPQQRRISLSRLVRPKSSGRSIPRSTSSDEHLPEPYYSHEFASFGSVSNSLGSSPYAVADMARKPKPAPPQQRPPPWTHRSGPPPMMIPFKGPSGPPRRPESSSSFGIFSSGYIGRRRPKSYHGRARRMEVLGEEEHEADLADEEDSSHRGRTPSLRPAKSFDAGHDVLRSSASSKHRLLHPAPRPKSIGAPIARSPAAGPFHHSNDNNSSHHLQPPVPNRSAWAAHERLWRSRREEATRIARPDDPSPAVPAPSSSRASSAQSSTITTWPEQDYFNDPTPPPPPALPPPEPLSAPPSAPAPPPPIAPGGGSGGGGSGGFDLPVISAQARPRPRSEGLALSKSQPDLRARFGPRAGGGGGGGQEGFRGSYEGQAVRAQRISASPRLVPTVMKRGGGGVGRERAVVGGEGRE